MATYLILNLLFMVAVILVLRFRSIPKPAKAWWVALFCLLILTAVFDNLIILFDIVDYDKTKLLGLYVRVAPVEDFMYAVLAVLIIPVLWQRLEKRHV